MPDQPALSLAPDWFAGDDGVRAEPFDAIELPLGALWNA